jgi:hypothetical protein
VTDIAIPEQRTVTTYQPAPPGSDLMAWVRDAERIESIAMKLANTAFVPATLRGKPVEITAALLAGMELGLPPMAALRSMDVIQGTPALRAHAMRGLVQSKGHGIELVESTPDRCVMRGRRKGADDWQTVTWTIQRAAQLGLTSKDQWKKQPGTMLIARATGELCRLIAADALYAMPYAAEELRAADFGEAEVVPDAPRVTFEEITRGQAPAIAPEPPVGSWDDVEYPDAVQVDEQPYTAPEWPAVAQPGGAQ